MTANHQQDEQFFRAVVAPLEDHSDWGRTPDSPSTSTAIEQAADSKLGELFYTHRDTEARLHVRMPDRGTPKGAMDAILDQPLDPLLDQRGDPGTFTATLSAAHQTIADRHRTGYIEPNAHPSMILNLVVPIPYEQDQWEESIEAASSVTERVEQLHSAIERPVKELVDGSDPR